MAQQGRKARRSDLDHLSPFALSLSKGMHQALPAPRADGPQIGLPLRRKLKATNRGPTSCRTARTPLSYTHHLVLGSPSLFDSIDHPRLCRQHGRDPFSAPVIALTFP